MTLAWIDATAGVAGDMMLAALIDAGADLAAVQTAVDAVVAGAVRLSTRTVDRQGQRGLALDVEVLVDDPPHRRWTQVRQLVTDAALHPRTRELALATLGRLAEAEGRVHGIDAEEVHFHEVGALDSIADVVGTCEAFRLLGIERAVGSTIAVGSGRVRVAHGLMPVPVPAVAELALGWPTTSGVIPPRALGHHHHDHEHPHDHSHSHPAAASGDIGELATPTGVALVRALCASSGAQPAMVTTAVGVGAGTKDIVGRPNVVRVLLGTEHTEAPADVVTEVQANVDDLDPRLWPGVLDSLLAAGARDAWLVPSLAKKGRPAHVVHALVSAAGVEAVTDALFATTTTFGVRRHDTVHRTTLDRRWAEVDVQGQRVRIKLAVRDARVVRAAPEFDDVARAATALGRTQIEVLALATAAAERAGLVAGSAEQRVDDASHG